MPRKIIGPEREQGEDCVMSSFLACADHQILLGDRMGEDRMGVVFGVYRLEPEGRRPVV